MCHSTMIKSNSLPFARKSTETQTSVVIEWFPGFERKQDLQGGWFYNLLFQKS